MASQTVRPIAFESIVTDQVDNNTNTNQIYKSSINTIMTDLNREEVRLKTFINWPLQWLDKHQLAQTGMFYTNVDDKVKCQFCGVEIGRWEQEDQPVPEHQRWSPNCPLLRRRITNNVPLSGDDLDRVLSPITNDSLATTATQADGDVQPETCRAQTGSGNYFPEYPEFGVESARLRTFEAWPRNLKQKPHQLAEAGFFYTGVGDRVRCFSCGGGLKDWDDNDEPWEKHARLFSQCRFVKLKKGQVYIDSMSVKPTAVEEKEVDVGPILAEDAVTIASRGTTSAEEEVSSSAASSSRDVAPSMPATKTSTALPAVGNDATISKGKLCKICYGAEYSTAFRKCGHVVACAKCASSVTKCLICLEPVNEIVHISFSN